MDYDSNDEPTESRCEQKHPPGGTMPTIRTEKQFVDKSDRIVQRYPSESTGDTGNDAEDKKSL